MSKTVKTVRSRGLIFSIDPSNKRDKELLNFVWVGNAEETYLGTIETKHQARTLIKILQTVMKDLK